MLACNENCLYNYSTISPNKYFNINGGLLEPRNEKLNELTNEVKKISYFLSGGVNDNEQERWLRSDNLINYDYIKFQNDFIKLLDINIAIDKFYYYWDLCLQNNRLNGKKTEFTVFEIENLYSYIDILNRKFKKIKYIDILRTPLDQIKSQKIDILFRGPKKGFTGALSSQSNVYFQALSGIVEQHKFNLSNKKYKNFYKIELDALRNMNDHDATKLSKFLFENNFHLHKNDLVETSKYKIFKNKYIDFSSSSRSYFLPERQQHHNKKITKENIMEFTFIHEKYFYYFMNYIGVKLKKKKKIKIFMNIIIICISFPVILFFTSLLGFKDLQRRNKLRKIIKMRLNSTLIIIKIIPIIVSLLFSRLFDPKK